MKKELTRRDLIGRAGLVLGGAVTLGTLQGCGDENDPCPAPQECADAAAKLKAFPYEQHLPADFTLNKAAVQEAAYHGYYAAAPAGGCGHGAWSALLAELARAGNPFDQLPALFGQFGAGGVAAYGSICGAVLGGSLIINSLVATSGPRNNMLTELMRWYETHEFPAYVPTTVDPAEASATGTGTGKLVLDWGSEQDKPDFVKVAPGSHLCHASVSGWCARQDPRVNAGGATQPDKKARCARVTADVAGKVVDMLNAYLASGALGGRSFGTPAVPTTVSGCTTCHDLAVKTHGSSASPTSMPAVSSGMSCPTCHADKLPLEGATHAPGATTCGSCH